MTAASVVVGFFLLAPRGFTGFFGGGFAEVVGLGDARKKTEGEGIWISMRCDNEIDGLYDSVLGEQNHLSTCY